MFHACHLGMLDDVRIYLVYDVAVCCVQVFAQPHLNHTYGWQRPRSSHATTTAACLATLQDCLYGFPLGLPLASVACVCEAHP